MERASRLSTANTKSAQDGAPTIAALGNIRPAVIGRLDCL
jgi:hypothetical protein